MINIKVWKDGENLTVNYLKKLGYKIVYTNYKCKQAELDIVSILPKKVQKRFILSENNIKNLKNNDKFKYKLEKMSLKNRLKNLQDLLVITEVKSRSNQKFGTGLEAIDRNKIRHMQLGAENLQKEKRFNNMQVRFDVASIDGGEITYIENAF